MAQKGLERIKNCYTALQNQLKNNNTGVDEAGGQEILAKVTAIQDAFEDAMNDDFNTPLGIVELLKFVSCELRSKLRRSTVFLLVNQTL